MWNCNFKTCIEEERVGAEKNLSTNFYKLRLSARSNSKFSFSAVIEKLEMMWQFYGLILIEAKICLPTTVIKLGKKCLKAEFTREIAQFLFCYKIWWYLRHEGIQEMANDRWIKHFRHSRASWVIQLALWRRRLATTTSEVVTRL